MSVRRTSHMFLQEYCGKIIYFIEVTHPYMHLNCIIPRNVKQLCLENNIYNYVREYVIYQICINKKIQIHLWVALCHNIYCTLLGFWFYIFHMSWFLVAAWVTQLIGLVSQESPSGWYMSGHLYNVFAFSQPFLCQQDQDIHLYAVK